MKEGITVEAPSVALVGVGAMGEAILAGMLASGVDRARVTAVERTQDRRDELARRYGVSCTGDVAEGVRGSDVVVVAVKPHDVVSVAGQVAAAAASGSVVASVAAGVPLEVLQRHLPGLPVVRVMPNTPARAGVGALGLARGELAEDAHVAAVRALLSPLGIVVETTDAQLDAVTAISGSGPAYVFLVAEALVDAGVLLGLTREVSQRLATQTLLGAATLLTEEGADPTALRAAVTSPAGTTAAALQVLEERGLRAALAAAAVAARDRSVELGRAARDEA